MLLSSCTVFHFDCLQFSQVFIVISTCPRAAEKTISSCCFNCSARFFCLSFSECDENNQVNMKHSCRVILFNDQCDSCSQLTSIYSVLTIFVSRRLVMLARPTGNTALTATIPASNSLQKIQPFRYKKYLIRN